MLGDLIKVFESCPDGASFKEGFKNPHSYRGDYNQLAVEPKDACTKEELLSCLKDALDNTYTGYKGGEFVMDESVDVYLAWEGCTSKSMIVGWGNNIEDGFILLTKEPMW